GGAENGIDIALAPTGVVISGQTNSDGLASAGAFQTARAGGTDGFVASFSTDLSTLNFCTYLGTDGSDQANSVSASFSNGSIYVGGTVSPETIPFFTPAAAFKTAPLGDQDGFVIRLTDDGTTAIWSTLLGGAGTDSVREIGLDSANNVYAVGATTS